MAKKGPPPGGKPSDRPKPSTGPDLWSEVMRDLPATERRFIRLVLQGLPHGQAAVEAGWHDPMVAVMLLGRERVRVALETLAPLLPDPAMARKAMEPLIRSRMMGMVQRGGAGAISAARDLLSDAGESPAASGKASGASAAWEERQRQRKASGPGAA